MAEKKIIVDIDIKADDIRAAKEAQDAAAKSMRIYQQEVNALKTQQKEINALYKVGAIDSKEYAKQQTDVKVKLAETNKGLREANKTMINNKTVVDAANGSNEQLKARLSLLTAEQNKLTKSQRESTKEGKQLEATIRTISEKLKANESAVGNNTRNVGNYKGALNGAVNSLKNFASALGITAGIAGLTKVIKDGIGIFASFEKANSNLEAVLGATKEQMKQLSDQAKELGATTSFTASQVVELQTEFAKLGFPTEDITQMTESTLNAAAAMGADLASAAKLTGSILKSFQLDASESARVNDVLAASTTKSALDFQKLSSSMSSIAPVANKFGFSLEGTVSLLGELSNAGFDASSAATATRKILLNLADSNGDLAKSLKEPVKDLPSLIAGLKQLKGEGIDLGAALELTDVKSVAAFATFLDGTDSITSLNAALIEAGESGGDFSKNMAAIQLDNLTGAMTILTSAWEGFILSLDDGNGSFGTFLKTSVKVVTELLSIATGTAKMRSELDEAGQRIRDIAEGFISVMSVVKGVVAAYLAYKAAVIVTTIATQAMAAATAIANTGMKAFNVTTKANPIGLLAGVLAGVITSMNAFAKKTKEATQEQLDFNKAVQDGINLTKNTKSIEERAAAIDGLNKSQTEKLKSDIETELSLIDEKEAKIITIKKAADAKANKIRREQGAAALEVSLASLIGERDAAIEAEIGKTEAVFIEEKKRLLAVKAAADAKIKTFKDVVIVEKLTAEELQKIADKKAKAEKDAADAIIKAWQDKRKAIDELAENEKNEAIASIDNAEKRAERIAYLDKQALLDKIANIDEETIAATAGADSIGAVDQEKYAKQLQERAKYEAQIAEMNRAAAAEAFSAKIALLSLDEKLENDAAELSIDNEKELAIEKAKISIKFLETKLALMTAFAKADGELTDEELKNLQLLENAINKIKNGLGEESDVPSLAEALGLTDDELDAAVGVAQAIASTITGILQIAMQANQSRIDGIDALANAEINAIESSTLSEEKKADKIKAIEKKAAMEKYQLELKNFNLSKGLQITNAIIGTAQAAIAAYSSGAAVPIAGVALGPAMAAIAAAFGAVQIGFIASQKPPPPPKFADGGILSGASHARGGIQLYGNSGDYYGEAEGGEPILTKGVSRNPYLLQKASEINVAAGGKPLIKSSYMAAGGIASPTFAARQASTNNNAQLEFQIASLGDRIERMQPVVRVTDINRINGQAVRVQQSANL